MKKFSVTLRADAKPIETKPFYSKNKETALKEAEEKGRKNFPNSEVDAVNVEEI